MSLLTLLSLQQHRGREVAASLDAHDTTRQEVFALDMVAESDAKWMVAINMPKLAAVVSLMEVESAAPLTVVSNMQS